MRVKVKADSLSLYERVLAFLSQSHAQVQLQNDTRRMVAVDDPSDELRAGLLAMGATVSPDAQYSID